MVAPVDPEGALGTPARIAGSRADWISQPRWSPDGVLHFVAEPDGWMNLQRWVGGHAESIAPMAAEFASPDWIFGNAEYGFLPDGGILAVGRSNGRDRLHRIVVVTGRSRTYDLPYTEIMSVATDGDQATMRVAAPDPSRPGS